MLGAAAQGTVVVTPASGGGAISADTAATGGSGTWTTLGAITLAEGTKTDINQGTGATLVIRTPSGFEFNTASLPSVSFLSGADIQSASLAFSNATTLTLTFTVSARNFKDQLVIGNTGLQVRPTAGGPLAPARRLYRPSTGGGTASINGITASADGSSGTSFGALVETPGTFVKLQMLVPGETAAPGTPSGKTGSPSAQSAGSANVIRVNGVDTNWNIVTAANGTAYTIRLSHTDPNVAALSDTNLANGIASFSFTPRTAGSVTFTAVDVDDPSKTPPSPITASVVPGALAKLQVLLPGETAVPGKRDGKKRSARSAIRRNLVHWLGERRRCPVEPRERE